MNKQERIQMLRAMDTVMRALNDEEIFEIWLIDGIPDGTTEDSDFAAFADDITFADIMDTFVFVMGKACSIPESAQERRGTLYCDGVVNSMSF